MVLLHVLCVLSHVNRITLKIINSISNTAVQGLLRVRGER